MKRIKDFPLALCVLCLVICLLMSCAQTKDLPYRVCVTTYTYKSVGDLEIKADVHQVEDRVKRPVVVWIHGGALIVGGRASVPVWLRASLLDAGYDIISIDYRLAPETQLAGIIEDLEDAFKWIYQKGSKLLNIDTSKIAVAGGSAGGYLALTSGYRIRPAPTVLVSLWGYGDLIGPWQSESSTFPRHLQAKMTDEEAQKILSLPPIANVSDRNGNGWVFYQYCRQRGLWPKLVAGFDLHTQPEMFFPYMPVKNVTKDYPPTLLIHGVRDTDVPHEQSELMAAEFVKHDVPHVLFSVRNGEHSLWQGNPDDIQRSRELTVEFINKYMKD